MIMIVCMPVTVIRVRVMIMMPAWPPVPWPLAVSLSHRDGDHCGMPVIMIIMMPVMMIIMIILMPGPLALAVITATGSGI